MTISVSTSFTGHETSAPFAGKIASARNAAGYTVDQLALTCGLTSQEILALETGADSDPSRLKRVANALQLPLTAVL
ncbi:MULTISPECIES: helix-turn-helix domain-containing protein [Agrobacterium]|uniref:DNA-binding XRE family transcriptional regulator n=1 Tax=Agrobacterium larrymoorei TaxID=160699 RepID=A0AAJ2EQZ4_9HYPH|nr:helix-turn-helix domain-containing protein [Agrobacterium larrymoorei]MDQ1183478.1 DNA-binding XRE family transcriptional regulator [Agrobacterium larrymoorei]MDQ1195637.1 DNA-binding XRE family transcriptional regulator [Rhizobium sp. SORGH_AS_0787]MDR6101184.1 DNA-binding XRE family transcriptional regulator [Agrobacterium larrymoorei]